MAREIEEIQQSIIDVVEQNETLSLVFTSVSKTAIWRLTTYIVAVCAYTIEKLFDMHLLEVDGKMDKKAHNLLWYRNKALAFQYGHELLADSDTYEEGDTGSQIIKFAAATDGQDTSGAILKLKVAKDSSGNLAELSTDEIKAFAAYIARVKDAGVKIRIISQEADRLRLVLDLYYDPLVLDDKGQRLDGTGNTPVQDAITNYLENLPFDGEYSNMALIDELQKIEGVVIPELLSSEYKWGEYGWETISAKYNPEAGWSKVYDEDLTINWIPYV